MDMHLNTVAAKIGMTIAKLKPALPFIQKETIKRIITAKVKSIAHFGSQSIKGQPQNIIQRACAIIMRTNLEMFKNRE